MIPFWSLFWQKERPYRVRGHCFTTKTRATKCRQRALLTQLVTSAWEPCLTAPARQFMCSSHLRTWRTILLSLQIQEDNVFWRKERCLRQQSPVFLAPGTSFVEDIFSMNQAWGEMVSGWFKHITLTVEFISIIITSAPPQIIRHWSPRGWGPLL